MTSKGGWSRDRSVSRAKLRRSDMAGLLVVAEVAGHLGAGSGQARLDRPFGDGQLVRDLRDAEVGDVVEHGGDPDLRAELAQRLHDRDVVLGGLRPELDAQVGPKLR